MDVVVPEWVAPQRQEVIDCHRLAVRGEDAFRQGVSAALRWVLGIAPGPLTASSAGASAQLAEDEFFVAGKVELGESPLSAVYPVAMAEGIGRTLSWLLGWEQRPPMDLPRRPPPTADQLYAEDVAGEPWKYRLPEQQLVGRLAAQREASRLAHLAALADEETP